MASSSGLSFAGISSGLDTTAIIDAIIEVERLPIVRLEQRKLDEQNQLALLTNVKVKLASLQSALQRLTLRGTINAKQATSSSEAVSAVAGSAAVNGVYKVTVSQLATATSAKSTAAIGAEIDPGVALADAGFVTAPTEGTFTINGVVFTIGASTTLNDVVAAINANADVGVDASIVNDADGRPNKLQLTARTPGGAIQLGSFGDTSNFLSVTHLLDARRVGDTVTSARNLGAVDTEADLSAARLETPLSGLNPDGTGRFTINGVTIDYRNTDSLNEVINRINASEAGVTVSYDPVEDKLRIVATETGGQTISLRDNTGNLLAAVGLLSASQTLGQNALFTIDTVNGGQTLSSSSNTITNYIPGVTLTLNDVATDPVTVRVSQDTAATVEAVQAFVDAYNEVMDLIAQYTDYDPETKTSGGLTGDSTLLGVERQLKTLVASRGVGLSGRYRTFADVGISTGAIGSAVGTTDALTLDQDKLKAALEENPNAVADLFAGFGSTATLRGDGPGAISSISGAPRDHRAGTYAITVDAAAGTASVVFTPTGGVAGPAESETISAGGTFSTVIDGMQLTFPNPLVSGTEYVDVTVDLKGVGVALKDYLDDVLGAEGAFALREETANGVIADLDEQIQKGDERLERRRAALEREYTALEVQLAQMQTQLTSITAMFNSLLLSNSSANTNE